MVSEKGIYPSSVDKSLWESPVWIYKTGFDQQFNQELLKELFDIAMAVQTGHDTNPGNSLLDYTDRCPRLKEVLAIKQQVITDRVNQYLPNTQRALFSPISSWLNVKEPGEVIEMHSHPDSTVACTYYITTSTQGGEIYYLDTGRVGEHFTAVKTIQPESGDIIFFPSYVLHGVRANQDTGLRVSLSTDYSYKLTDDSEDKLILTSWVNSMLKIKDLL